MFGRQFEIERGYGTGIEWVIDGKWEIGIDEGEIEEGDGGYLENIG